MYLLCDLFQRSPDLDFRYKDSDGEGEINRIKKCLRPQKYTAGYATAPRRFPTPEFFVSVTAGHRSRFGIECVSMDRARTRGAHTPAAVQTIIGAFGFELKRRARALV